MHGFSPSDYLFPGPEVFLLELGQNCIYVLCFKMLNLCYFENVFTFFLHHQQVCDSKKNISRSTEYCEYTLCVYSFFQQLKKMANLIIIPNNYW